jgi:hypothetical protein
VNCILICDHFDKGTVVFMAVGMVWCERKEEDLNENIKIKL